MKSPIIYGWKRGVEFLYIGKSLQGYARFLHHHNVIGVVDELLDDDEIIIWYVTKKEIDKIEQELIKRYFPRWNKIFAERVKKRVCKLCKSPFETWNTHIHYCESCLKRIKKYANGEVVE